MKGTVSAFAERSFYAVVVKRMLDVLASVLLLLLFLCPILLLLLAVRIETRGSALFVQTRVGRNGRCFRIWKIRTMRMDAPHDRPSALFSKEERRRYLTRVGRFLRRSGFDELPQLWNVLMGQMSLVGPRPVIPEERELTMLRGVNGALSVRPGITGLAQVSGRDGVEIREKAEMDGYYAEHLSFLLDVRILILTLWNGFNGS